MRHFASHADAGSFISRRCDHISFTLRLEQLLVETGAGRKVQQPLGVSQREFSCRKLTSASSLDLPQESDLLLCSDG